MAKFYAWRRPAVYALTSAPATTARLKGELPITLQDDAGSVPASASFMLAGPGDVAALVPGQIIGRRPFPGCLDAESSMMAHVELAAADLPWRFSPVPGAAPATVRPWLVLVAGSSAEVSPLADGRVRLSGADLFATHPLNQAASWAHVHEVPGRTFSRILCPRPLEPAHDYVAALVPGWRATIGADGSTTLEDSWTSTTGTVTMPCFDWWTFRTRDDPDNFASIARRLEPLSTLERQQLTANGFGRAAVRVGPLPAEQPLSTTGALSVVPAPTDPPLRGPLPDTVADAVEALTSDVGGDGRWVLTLPRYDVPWHPGPVDGESWQWPPPGDDALPDGWRRELRVDPRHRGAAGLGSWIAIAWQDRIALGAARQVAAVAAAAQRIRHLTLGLTAARTLWMRRVPEDPLARLATLTPLLGRMPVHGGGGALDAVAGRTPMLARGLFSSAARRLLRRRGPLARAAAPGATSLSGLMEAANRCPETPSLPGSDAQVLEILADEGSTEHVVVGMSQRAFDVVMAVTGDERIAGEAAGSLEGGAGPGLVDGVRERPPEVACRPLSDLGAFAGSIAGGIDPTAARPAVVDRVIGTITGLRDPVLAEPDVAPEIDIPLWSFLADNSPDWLLPGAGDVPQDRVLALQTDPTFVDALLIGANAQTIGELRWRNIPITTRWTPLRRFWQRIDVGAGKAVPDIREVVALATDQPLWTDASALGDVSHLADPANGTNLVVVFHTELFLRYPATIVYATPNAGGAATWGDVPEIDGAGGAARVYPSFSGTIDPELVFFGFPLAPSAAADHWIVLEEPPPGYRFEYKAGAGGDGAAFALATFAPPVRVFLGNLL